MKFGSWQLPGIVALIGLVSAWGLWPDYNLLSEKAEVLSESLISSSRAPAILPALPNPEERFQGLLDRASDTLLSVHQASQLPDSQLHHPHPALARASEFLGEFRELWEENSSLRPKAFDFYWKCAEDSSLVLALQATCLWGLQDVGKLMGKSTRDLRPTLEAQNLYSYMRSLE